MLLTISDAQGPVAPVLHTAHHLLVERARFDFGAPVPGLGTEGIAKAIAALRRTASALCGARQPVVRRSGGPGRPGGSQGGARNHPN